MGIDVLLSFLRAPSFRSAVAARGTDAAHVLSVRNDPAREYPGVARVAARGYLPILTPLFSKPKLPCLPSETLEFHARPS